MTRRRCSCKNRGFLCEESHGSGEDGLRQPTSANRNRFCGGCLAGLEPRDSFQVRDMVALGVTLSNPEGHEDEYGNGWDFFSREAAAGLHIQPERGLWIQY